MSKYFRSSEGKEESIKTNHEVKRPLENIHVEKQNTQSGMISMKSRKMLHRELKKDNIIDESIGWNLPFHPHDVQRDMITTLLAAARSGYNAIIDSPTGTGKTLALLVGGLKFHEELRRMPTSKRKDMNETHGQKKKSCHLGITIRGTDSGGPKASQAKNVPPIFYCSRTHSQLQQVIRELQVLQKNDVHMNVLASREHYCINERVRTTLENRGNNLGEMCDKAVLMNQCSAHDNYPEYTRTVASVAHEWQIEDLVENGKAIDACPYYAARDLIFGSYINFCPYNYILDPLIRHETKIEGALRDAVIILDEAHNIDEVSRSALEWQWSKADLVTVVDEMKDFAEGDPVLYSKLSLTEKPETCAQMSALVRRLSQELISFFDSPVASQWRHTGPSSPGHSAISGTSRILFAREIENKLSLIQTIQNNADERKIFASALRSFLDFGVTFNTLDVEVRSVHTMKQTLLFLHLFLFRKSAFSLGVDVGKGLMEVYCADSSLAFKLLEQDVRCIILSSGTLPTTDYLSKELGVPLEKEVRCGHIVDVKTAVFARIVTSLGKCMYSTMYTTDFIDRVGRLLVKAVNATTHGRLCFFPSYRCLDIYRNRWNETRICADLARNGVLVFQEPRSTKLFGETLNSFRTASQREKGAVLLAVFRGKASEGIDFKDNMARLIVSIGVPYKSKAENRTIVKQKFNAETASLSGSSWYTTDAVTAVNQAIGRCIRHQNDYGALLLIDERWQKELFPLLPKWLRGALQASDDSDALFSAMGSFLKNRMNGTLSHQKVEYIEIE
ncbi:helicase-like protein [Perkinsela sp. CCAP 1560/4]|nr:helicase-like protein [Perkinsela sp. CCAP 1560/4]|eukprot:KNH07507.1 helicase-like protein [Perkinsela sp. CCAP 1560/4]